MRDAAVVYRSIGVRLGQDPRLRAYSAEAVSDVTQASLVAILDCARERQLAGGAGIGDPIGDFDLDVIAVRIASDPRVAALPPVVPAALLPIVLEIAAEEIER